MKFFYLFENYIDFDEINELWLSKSKSNSDYFEQIIKLQVESKILISLNRKVISIYIYINIYSNLYVNS
jgi:replication fork clamp-binding protein CrfC